jgi:hypothetical protein
MYINMLYRGIYRSLYTPASKLEFKKGRCLLLKDMKLERLVALNVSSMFAAPMVVLWGLKYKAYSILSAVLWPALPFFLYNMYLSPLVRSSVNGILLHNDGKTLTLRICCDTELQTYKIEELKFSKPEPQSRTLKAFSKVITLPNKEILFIPKIAEILHEDVFDKIMEGEEIFIEDNDKEEKEEKDEKDEKDENDSEKNE